MRIGKWVAGIGIALGLVACGGGGSDAGTSAFGSGSGSGSTSGGSNSTSTVMPAVTVVMSKDIVSVGDTVTATAAVASTDGSPLAGASVKFSTENASVNLSADTVSTDSSGRARVTMSVKPGTGYVADTLSARATVGSNSATGTIKFSANGASLIEALANANSVASAGDLVTLTAVIKGSNNVSLAGVPVTFSADSGTILSPSATTDSTGVATAKFSVGADRSNRNVRITVSSGGASGVLVLPVEGTKLSVSGVTTMAVGSSNTLNIKATDSRGNGISDATIAVSSSLGNQLAAPSVKTNAQGDATISYTATQSGSDTLTFTGLGASATTAVAVSREDFTFLVPDANIKIPLGTDQMIQIRYRRDGQPVANAAVRFTITAGELSSATATTDASGVASVKVRSSWAAPATVRAQLAAGAAQVSIPVAFVATQPAKLVLQTTPTAIGPNDPGSTTNQTQLVARVTDANGNPVPDQVVSFSRDQDPSGGTLAQSTSITDSSGVATVQYIAGQQSTATGGIRLRATVSGSESVYGLVTLTVSRSALFIALGTGNTITNLDPQTYKKQWTVYVTDSAGVAVPNVSITAKILPIDYRKGSLTFKSNFWSASPWDPSVSSFPKASGTGLVPAGYYIACKNEDTIHSDSRALNGVLDAGEDINSNGVLEPGNVISLETGAVKTDSSGRATLTLLYAESYVPWVQVRLQVQAVVSGTESTTEVRFVVDGLSDDFKNETVPPAGIGSPFGSRYRYDAATGTFTCDVAN